MSRDKGGEWKTINGARVFIKDGQTPKEAFAYHKKIHAMSAAELKEHCIVRLPDEQLPHSVGAKWANYLVKDFSTGINYKFVEGSKLQDQEVFAGKGTRIVYRDAYKYAEKIGGTPEEWQHVKGVGLLETDEGNLRAKIHWSQHEKYGKFDFFVKEWID